MKSHYEVLGVPPGSDREVVRRAYLSLARRHHPDAGGDPTEMLAVNDAWAVLSDPARRAIYDRSIGRPPGNIAAADAATFHDDDDLAWDAVLDEFEDRDDIDAGSTGRSAGRSSLVDTVSLLVVLVLAGSTAIALLFGMMLTIGELLGLGVFLGFLTGVAVVARLLLAMRSAVG